MAVFSYKCEFCGLIFKKLLKKKADLFLCDCGKEANLLLPSSIHSTNYEMRDAARGVQRPVGQDQQLKQRMHDHHDKFELEKKIDEHGMEEGIRNGWDKKIKKI